jgi:N-dimethylarginine dimethylaminohydrolase
MSVAKPSINDELSSLQRVVVCTPSQFFLDQPINKTQAHFFKKDPPTRERLLKNHFQFSQILKKNGVELLEFPNTSGSPFQMFTRDVGFVIGTQLFLARPVKEIRQKEIVVLKELLYRENISYFELDKGFIEGGDVFVHKKMVFVGIGQRTTIEGFSSLKDAVGDNLECIPIYLKEDILHLDTVFNIIDEKKAILYPNGLQKESSEKLKDYFEVFQIDQKEAFELAANFLFLREDLAITQKRHKKINDYLKSVNIKTIELDLNEMTKLGGGPRCASLPLVRL